MTTPKVELQPVQQPIAQEVKSFSRDQMGYTDRPISQKTQVRNVYLDSATYDGQHSIASAGTETLDGSVVRTRIGNLDFTYAGGFTTPTNSTYTITLSSFVGGTSAPSSGVVIINMIHTDKDSNLINTVPIAIPREACDGDGNAGTYTYAFKKGDTIVFSARNGTNQTLTVRIIATITKQS